MLTVSTVPLVLCTALVALTLLISGIAKAKDPQSTVTGIQNLGLEKIAPTRAVSLILPWFEICFGGGAVVVAGAFACCDCFGFGIDSDAVLYGGDCARVGDGSYWRVVIVSVLSRMRR